jgi:hypothetical protein
MMVSQISQHQEAPIQKDSMPWLIEMKTESIRKVIQRSYPPSMPNFEYYTFSTFHLKPLSSEKDSHSLQNV